jgi:hypothetical protein
MQDQSSKKDAEMQDMQKPAAVVPNNAEAEKKKKEKLQQAFKKFIVQIKSGCDK